VSEVFLLLIASMIFGVGVCVCVLLESIRDVIKDNALYHKVNSYKIDNLHVRVSQLLTEEERAAFDRYLVTSEKPPAKPFR
jgi:hypothetical protein